MKKINVLVLLAGLLHYASASFAGGPLLTYETCKPVVFPASAMPIPYTVDQGALGAFSNAEAAAIVDDCFGVWQAVPTAAISFSNAGFIAQDITENNVDQYLTSIQGTGVSPVIFDSDGGIIDYYYGAGASDNIIGFSGSSTDATGSYYTDGLSLLNGRFTQAPYNWDAALFKATFVHEFGHFIGLDHCQIHLDFVHDGNTANDIYIPTMFPTSTDDDTSLGNLNPDDEAALTLLYPGTDAVVNDSYGRIRGTLRWLSRLPARGANVIAVKQGDALMSRFSSVSDYCGQRDGSFEMLVTPGTYNFNWLSPKLQ